MSNKLLIYFELNFCAMQHGTSSSIQNHFVFENDGGNERPMDFSYMEKFELFGAYNRYIHSEVDVLLGAIEGNNGCHFLWFSNWTFPTIK
ncbi:hypothetical protein Avbf_03364 [Armadillidium vulgare]|nr:hypothetical protein Avbf_03364 [Armadillidium vulgare]